MPQDQSYDVFLSYNSVDKPAVEELARRLAQEGIHPWLDRWHLVPGEPWQEAIEEALKQSEAVAVFIGPSGISPWHNEEMRAALDRAVRTHDNYRVIPVLLPGAMETAVTGFLAQRTAVDFGPGLDDADAFARLMAGVLGQPPEQVGAFTLPDEPTPYPGLLPFTTQQASFFFGRGVERDRLLARVRESSFVVIVGASGSGKSSLVLAGLLPALDEDWHALVLVPGARPLRSLANQLATLAPPGDRLQLADEIETRLADRVDGLGTAASTLLTNHPQIATLLIVVDQVEELFTQVLGTSNEIRQQQVQFIANLVNAVQTSAGQVRTVLTLRADFVRHCLDFADLCAMLEPNQFLLGPMGEDALREAVVRPAQAVGAMFEKGLVGRLLDDMRDQPAALPLLQSALAQLWQRRHGVWLTHAAYEAIGGVSGAIDQRAEAVYEQLSEEQKHLARNLFVRLVSLGEDTSDTRRRVHRDELNPMGVAPEEMEKLIGILSHRDVRLVTADVSTVELAHEALLEQWGRLRHWLREDRATLHTHRELTNASREWEQHDRDASYLYRGSRLGRVEQWTKTRVADLSALEHEFIIASVAAQRAEFAAHRQRRALRIAVPGLLAVVVVAIVALVWLYVTGWRLPTGRWVHLGNQEMPAYAIALDPTDPDMICVGTDDGRILKSSDKGQHWTQLLATSDRWIDVTISPHISGTLYAGGTRIATDTSENPRGVMYRSTDGGEHWTDLGTVLDAARTLSLIEDPFIPKTLYMYDARHPYIYKSLDGGTGWMTITVASNGQNITALAMDILDETVPVLYAGSGAGHLWRSTDRGVTWQDIPLKVSLAYIMDIVTDPVDASVLYVLDNKQLYCIQTNTDQDRARLLIDGFNGLLKVAVDPHSPKVIFVSAIGGNVSIIQKREDESCYQQIASQEDFLESGLKLWLAAQDLAVSDRDPYYLYAATEKGLFGWRPSSEMTDWFD